MNNIYFKYLFYYLIKIKTFNIDIYINIEYNEIEDNALLLLEVIT